MANACPTLRLEARVSASFLGLGRRVEIGAHCVRSGGSVSEPEIGCGLCHLPETPTSAGSESP